MPNSGSRGSDASAYVLEKHSNLRPKMLSLCVLRTVNVRKSNNKMKFSEKQKSFLVVALLACPEITNHVKIVTHTFVAVGR